MTAVNPEETQATIDGILPVGILWLERGRGSSGRRRVLQGLRLIVPRGCTQLTLSRIPWLNERAAQWELDAQTEELEQRTPVRGEVEQVIRSGAEMAFLLHGLEFARVRAGYAGNSFNAQEEIRSVRERARPH